jgi:hypothetical protein
MLTREHDNFEAITGELIVPLRTRFWEAIGGRKFVGFLIGTGLLVWIVQKNIDWRLAGAVIGGFAALYLIYAAANVKGKINIGGTTIETNGDSKIPAAGPGAPIENRE